MYIFFNIPSHPPGQIMQHMQIKISPFWTRSLSQKDEFDAIASMSPLQDSVAFKLLLIHPSGTVGSP